MDSTTTMDTTTLYGYVPTAWIQILFAAACFMTICTTIPSLFVKYPKPGLGLLILLGILFQLTGHVAVTVSAYTPESIPAWITQFIAFNMGRGFSRLTVCYVYGKMVNTFAPRIAKRAKEVGQTTDTLCTGLWFAILPVVSSPFVIWLWADRITKVIHLGHEDIIRQPYEGAVMVIGVMPMILTSLVIGYLIGTICESRQTIPWFRLTWMSGFLITLMIVPFFLLAQDIFVLIKLINVDYHNEMMELVFDMGVTKAVLMFLGSQTYEMAMAWKENPPKELQEIVMLWRNLTSRRTQEESGHDNQHYEVRTGDDQV